MIHKYGIDISVFQGNINLKPYKDQFVIIRGGYWNKVDSKAERNMNLCEKLNIPYGVYWYSYALTEKEAETEAKACLKLIKGRNIKVGVWIDMEDADRYKKRHGFPSNKTINAIINKFCKIISDAGFYAGVYASQSWFDSKINVSYPKWIARWGSNNGKINVDLSGKCVLHQYTSKPLDKDVMLVPIETFKNGVTPQPKPTPTKKKKTVNELAKEVIAGKWGSGKTRKKKLEKAGYNYNAVQKEVNRILAEQKNSLANKIKKACIEQAKWMKNYTYNWSKWKPRNVEQSKYYGTCITFVACVLQRLKYLKSGEYIWHNGSGFGTGKVRGVTKDMSLKYMNNRQISECKDELKAGDILLVDDNKSGKSGKGGHIFIFTGKWDSNGNPIIYDNHSCERVKKGQSPERSYKKTRKLLARVRLKELKKSNKEIAKEVIQGKWGNGDERKKRLTEAGYDYNAVQKEVNNLLK